MLESEPNLVKMSVFAQRSGVPAPTIKHYVREGLLPKPVRTSRTMAYYDAGHMMYIHMKSLRKLKADIAAFFASE